MWRSLNKTIVAITAPATSLVAVASVVAASFAAVTAADERPERAELRREHAEQLLNMSASRGNARIGSDGRLLALRGRFALPREGRAAGTDRSEAVRIFLRRHSTALGLPEDLSGLAMARSTDDRGGTVLRFEQRHQGTPVVGGSIVVGLDAAGNLIHLTNDHVPGIDIETAPRVTAAEALARAEEALGRPFDFLDGESALVIAAGDKEHPERRLAWEIRGGMRRPRADWMVFVDARTGDVIRVHDRIRRAGPQCMPCNPNVDPQCGRIFIYNPVVVLDNPALNDGSNVDAAQSGCMLHNLTSPSLLDGTYATTAITAGRVGPPWNWLRSANQPAVDEVNVYYHVNRSKEYLNTLGFASVMNFSINADAHDPMLGDNAHYVPSIKILEFGTGGVDDAQDPDIIYHEYGHAIQDNQVPGFGDTIEGGAMGEGFGDYWASALMEDDAATLLGAACVAEWDATTYNPWNGVQGTGCLRRVDGAKQYPQDQVFEVHDDGEIWSAALWRMRQAVGGPVGDAIAVKAHSFLNAAADIIDGSDALLAADIALYDGSHEGAIDAAMAQGGIPRSEIPASSTGLTQTFPFVCETAHNYVNLEYKECSLTVPGATRVRFHFSRVGTEEDYDILRISDADFGQVQALTGTPFGSGPGVSAAVHGDTIVARFKADPSVRSYGFRIDGAEFSIGAGAVPDGANVQGAPLMVSLEGGNVTLTWGASCGGGTDYAIYEGTLGNYMSHVPVACSTSGLTSSTFPAPGHSTYYLVVPVVPGAEGSYGLRSNGTERPPSATACRPQQILDDCS